MIKTKFVANVQPDSEGYRITVAQMDFLDILVENPKDFEIETRRILSEMLELEQDSFELEFVNSRA